MIANRKEIKVKRRTIISSGAPTSQNKESKTVDATPIIKFKKPLLTPVIRGMDLFFDFSTSDIFAPAKTEYPQFLQNLNPSEVCNSLH